MGEMGATYMFMEWKLFDKIPMRGSISYKELATSVGAEEAVVCECIPSAQPCEGTQSDSYTMQLALAVCSPPPVG